LECCVYSLVFGLIIGSSSHMSVTRAVVMGVFYFLLVNALLFHMAYSQRAAFMAQLECMHLQAQAHENETRQQFVEHDQKIMQEQVERLKIQVLMCLNNSTPLAKAQRTAVETEAQSETVHLRVGSVPKVGVNNNMPENPCVAVSILDGKIEVCYSMNENQTAASSAGSAEYSPCIRAGSHAFVKVAGKHGTFFFENTTFAQTNITLQEKKP